MTGRGVRAASAPSVASVSIWAQPTTTHRSRNLCCRAELNSDAHSRLPACAPSGGVREVVRENRNGPASSQLVTWLRASVVAWAANAQFRRLLWRVRVAELVRVEPCPRKSGNCLRMRSILEGNVKRVHVMCGEECCTNQHVRSCLPRCESRCYDGVLRRTPVPLVMKKEGGSVAGW